MASASDKGFRIRPATAADLPALRPVFEAAKGIMRADGNAEQWSAPGFPPDDLLLRDIAREGGFIIENRWPVEAGHDEEKTVMPGLTGHLAAPRIVAYFALLSSTAHGSPTGRTASSTGWRAIRKCTESFQR